MTGFRTSDQNMALWHRIGGEGFPPLGWNEDHNSHLVTRAANCRDTPKLNALRNCFEAAMDFDTAIGCAGMSDLPEVTRNIIRGLWDRWETAFNAV